MAQVEIRSRGVKARLDDERPPGAKPRPQLSFDEDIAGSTPDFSQLVVDGRAACQSLMGLIET